MFQRPCFQVLNRKMNHGQDLDERQWMQQRSTRVGVIVFRQTRGQARGVFEITTGVSDALAVKVGDLAPKIVHDG